MVVLLAREPQGLRYPQGPHALAKIRRVYESDERMRNVRSSRVGSLNVAVQLFLVDPTLSPCAPDLLHPSSLIASQHTFRIVTEFSTRPHWKPSTGPRQRLGFYRNASSSVCESRAASTALEYFAEQATGPTTHRNQNLIGALRARHLQSYNWACQAWSNEACYDRSAIDSARRTTSTTIPAEHTMGGSDSSALCSPVLCAPEQRPS